MDKVLNVYRTMEFRITEDGMLRTIVARIRLKGIIIVYGHEIIFEKSFRMELDPSASDKIADLERFIVETEKLVEKLKVEFEQRASFVQRVLEIANKHGFSIEFVIKGEA